MGIATTESAHSDFPIGLAGLFRRFWPPYVRSGSFVLSPVMAERLYLGARYTRMLRAGAEFLGLVAWKLKSRPQHNPLFFPAEEDAARVR